MTNHVTRNNECRPVKTIVSANKAASGRQGNTKSNQIRSASILIGRQTYVESVLFWCCSLLPLISETAELPPIKCRRGLVYRLNVNYWLRHLVHQIFSRAKKSEIWSRFLTALAFDVFWFPDGATYIGNVKYVHCAGDFPEIWCRSVHQTLRSVV